MCVYQSLLVARSNSTDGLMEVILLLADAGDQRRPGPDDPGHCRHPRQLPDGRNVVSVCHGDVSLLLTSPYHSDQGIFLFPCVFISICQ